MLATVRNRRGIVSAVEPFDGEDGRYHVVHLEYNDDQLPVRDQLLWEREPHTNVLEPSALPQAASSDPMPADDFDALLRTARWTSLSPYVDPDGKGPVERLPIASPFHGAIQVEDYQLVPLLKALRMPRVNLLIADDVGLGKTVEAGLILSELLLRRRIQRVLILTPASLRMQWQEAMWQKFSLPFDLVDRGQTQSLRRSIGMDANPWRSFSRIITSYHYLRQEDVCEQFLAACHTPEGSPHLPWDLLIVDECHNLMPSGIGEESDLTRMLRLVAPQFEHRIFLSATPHNGHTRCFTGLLEILDPVRFSQTNELKPAEKQRIQQVVLRRLKREINARTSPPKFSTRRPPQALALKLSPEEVALSAAFDGFRTAVRRIISSAQGKRRRAGTFAVEILGKRLLSCPTAFAESWRRCKVGLAGADAAEDDEVGAVEKSVRRETGDDLELQTREAVAATVIGAWLKPIAGELRQEIAAIDEAVGGLGFDLSGNAITLQNPFADARLDIFIVLIEDLLRRGGNWRNDERLVIFTEYKTTLDYLVRRLRERYEPERILTLFGSGGKEGMDEKERDRVKGAFNDPADQVRILVATDAAAEGLDLQRTARYLLHYDCPWNPSRLEQRNGRLDRYGQARDVTIHYFVSDQDHDLRFLAHVIQKADDIREDLGSVNELFDEAARRRLVHGESLQLVQTEFDRQVEAARGRAALNADVSVATDQYGINAAAELAATATEIDLYPHSLRDTLESAMAIRGGRPQLECSDESKTCKILRPDLPGWTDVIDDSLRQTRSGTSRGPMSRIAFSPDPFQEDVGGRTIFVPRRDVQLMHLSHPMLQKAMGSLSRRRFPGTGEGLSRWTVRLGGVPDGSDALVLLSLEELAINELRESFHHWVRTIGIPVQKGKLAGPIPHTPALQFAHGATTTDGKHHKLARDIFDDVEPDLKAFVQKQAQKLTGELRRQLAVDGQQARKEEEERFRSRQGELSSLISENTLNKLRNEVDQLKVQRAQGLLFEEAEALDRIDRSIEEFNEEIVRRTRHYEEIREQLTKERDRIQKQVLPKRYALSGEAQVFPVCVEIRLPGGTA